MLSLITNASAIIDKYLGKLQGIKPGSKAYDDAMHKGADGALIATRDRIHTKGTAGDGSAIGQYDQKPIYISSTQIPSPGEATGKSGKSVFAIGNPHRSRYFPGGYNEYKSSTGGSGGVNLVLTGQMRDSYQVIKTSEGYGLGWTEEELVNRAAALEEKYGKKIWTLTEDERKAFIASMENDLRIQ